MSFLDLEGKVYLVVGFANRKSIAWSVSKSLMEEGARVLFSVRSEKRKNELLSLLPEAEIFVCDFEDEKQYKEKLEVIKENYFPKVSNETTQTLTEEVENNSPENVEQTEPSVDFYAKALKRHNIN